MELNIENSVLLAVVITMCSLIQGYFGFGFTLVAVGVLTIIFDPQIVVPFIVLPALINCGILAWKLKKEANFRDIAVMFIIASLFIPPGAFLLSNMNKSLFFVGLGVLIIISATLKITGLINFRFDNNFVKYVSASLGGLLSGAFGISGPPLVIYANNCQWSHARAKANLQFLFLALSFPKIASYYAFGIMNTNLALNSMLYCPLVILFTLLGNHLSKESPAEKFAIRLQYAILIMGIVFLLKAF